MIIYNLDLVWFIVTPGKADTVLVIDTNAILSGPIPTQEFELIAGWQS